jgi:lipoate-protein ligase A
MGLRFSAGAMNRFPGYTFEVLEIYEGTGTPVDDLAFEAWMLDRAAAGHPCVQISSWTGPVVVLGYAQKPEEVDLVWCRSHGIPVYRRLTGGTGVIHASDLGVALALPATHPWAAGVVGLYNRFLGVLEPALHAYEPRIERKQDPPRASRVRSPVCFLDQLSDTLLVNGRKVVGCAQTRRRGAVLIHAAILLGLDASLYASVFRADAAQIGAGLGAAVDGGDWREIGSAIADAAANRLDEGIVNRPRPEIGLGYREPYKEARWAPLVFGDIES